jgi:hypothetical protein
MVASLDCQIISAYCRSVLEVETELITGGNPPDVIAIA